jgi:hypothetical protein
MPMQAASLELLEKANIPAPQARAIVQAIGIEIAAARDSRAAEYDRLLWRTDESGQKTAELRSEMRALAKRCMRDLNLFLLVETAVVIEFAYLCLALHQR